MDENMVKKAKTTQKEELREERQKKKRHTTSFGISNNWRACKQRSVRKMFLLCASAKNVEKSTLPCKIEKRFKGSKTTYSQKGKKKVQCLK